MEIRNLGEVEEYIQYLIRERPGFSITKDIVLELHRLVVNGLYDCAGKFRTAYYQVRVTSETFYPANPYEVEYRVRDLLERIRAHKNDNTDLEEVIPQATAFFHEFNQIHPFNGGNGRVSRALLNIVLIQEDLLDPDLSIHYHLKQDNARYLEALQIADQGDLMPLQALITRACLEAYLDWWYDLLTTSNNLHLVQPQLRDVLEPNQRRQLTEEQFADLSTRFVEQVQSPDFLSEIGSTER